MFEIDCLDSYDNTIENFTQWDIDQKLKLVLHDCDEGFLSIAPFVHFANRNSDEALVVRSEVQGEDAIIVEVPNILLTESYPLLVYVYLTDSIDVSSQRTIVKAEIPIRARVKPSDYEYVENIERITAEQIKQEIEFGIVDKINDGFLAVEGWTFIDTVTGAHHKIYVENGKIKFDMNNGDSGDDSDDEEYIDNVDQLIEFSKTNRAMIKELQRNVLYSVDSGTMITTNDALSDARPLSMTVYGNTRQNLWINPSGSSNGVTVTSNEDGSVTVSGTGSGNNSVSTSVFYTLKPGETYTLSIDKETDFSSYGFFVQSYDGSSYTTLGRVVGATKSAKITVPSSSVACRVGVQVVDTTEISNTYRVMLNEGSEAEPWCPPGLMSVGYLRDDEKNLWVNPIWMNNGIIVQTEKDGSMSIKGTAEDDFSIAAASENLVKGKTYTFSLADGDLPSGVRIEIVQRNNENTVVDQQTLSNSTKIKTFTIRDDAEKIQYCVYVDNEISVDTVCRIMLNEGSTGQPWVIPGSESCVRVVTENGDSEKVTETIIDLQGYELCSLPDGTRDELVINSSGNAKLVKRTQSVMVTGESNIHAYSDINPCAVVADILPVAAIGTLPIHCDKLPYQNGIWDDSIQMTGIDTSGNCNLYFKVAGMSTFEEYKTWAASNPFKVICDSSEAQEISLDNITTPTLPSSISHVFVNDKVQTELSVKYMRDMNAIIDNGSLKGEPGEDGITPTIGTNGNWFIGDVDTGKSSRGEKGEKGEPGEQGEKGEPGTGIKILGKYDSLEELKQEHPTGNEGDCYTVNGVLYVWSGTEWLDVGNIKGEKGDTPTIGDNGNWFIGEEDTGKPSRGENGQDGQDGADGKDGIDGITPTIGENGNWYFGETDTGKPSRGVKGDTGEKGEPGIQGIPGQDGADGKDGEGVPPGGTKGQVLMKLSADDYDSDWVEIEETSAHTHIASDITSGVFSPDLIPIITVDKGGTGATTAPDARTNIGAIGADNIKAGSKITVSKNGSDVTIDLASNIPVSMFINDYKYQTESQVSSAIDAKLGSVYKYKGSKANESALPSSGNTEGDVYNVEDTGMNYAWDGTKWDALGVATTLVDLGVTVTADELNYMDGVTSNVQTQIDGKAASNHTHAEYAASDHTHNGASSSVSGFMSAIDKTKLDGIEEKANKYVHPAATARISGLYKIAVDDTGHVSDVVAVVKDDITALGIPGQDTNTTYEIATTSTSGLMSFADKTKLDGIKFASDEDFKAYMGIG